MAMKRLRGDLRVGWEVNLVRRRVYRVCLREGVCDVSLRRDCSKWR